MTATETPSQGPHSDEEPPAFASWKLLYGTALVSAVLVMALIAAFSRFAF